MKPKVSIKENPTRINRIPATVRNVDHPSEVGPLKKNRADFHVEKFYTIIKQKGYVMTWRKALLCPCRSPESDQPSLTCGSCDGRGFVYIHPVQILALLTGIDSKQSHFKIPGHWLQGQCSVTVEPQYRLGYYDSLEMQDGILVFSEWIRKGDRHGSKATLPANTDRARYRIVRINAALIHDGDNVIELEDKVHFVVKDGLLVWTPTGSRVVEDGQVVTLHYEFHPVFLVTSHANVLRNTITQRKSVTQEVRDLPIQAIAQLEYLVRPEGTSGA